MNCLCESRLYDALKFYNEYDDAIKTHKMYLGVIGRFFEKIFGDDGFRAELTRSLEKKYSMSWGEMKYIINHSDYD